MLGNLQQHLDIIFFFYGLAYVTLGTTIFYQIRATRHSQYKLFEILWLLGLFGLMHGIHEFVEMFAFTKGDLLVFETIGAFFTSVSFIFLLAFGYRVINLNSKRIGSWFPLLMIFSVFALPLIIDGPFLHNFKVFIRYFLGFPGSLLTAIGLSLYYVEAISPTDRFKFKRLFIYVTLFFIAYAVFGGLITVEATYLPASLINKQWFISIMRFPVEVFRAIFAIGITWSMWQILNIFNLEAATEKEQLDQELLESKKLLEQRVKNRTAALYSSNELLKQEITDRKKAEQSLLESNARFQTVLDSLDAIVYVADMETYEILFANKYLRDNFGDITGKICWQSLQQGQEGPCGFCTNDRLIDSRGNPEQPYVWEFKNTLNQKWYAIQDRAIKWTDNSLVRLEIAVDITASKLTQEALRESQRRYSNLISNANDAIFIADAETGIITETNKKAEELLGIPAERIVGMHQSDLHPDAAKSYYERTFKAHVKKGHTVAKDLYVKHSDGHLIPVEISASVIELEEGKVMLGIVRDVTERKQIEAIKDKVDLAKQIVRAVENERKSLSIAIHDDLLQVAFSALAYCKSVYNVSIESMSGKDRLDLAIKCLDNLLETGRKIISQLEPPMLKSIGLIPAIQEQAKNLFEGYDIKLKIKGTELSRLRGEVEVAIFRIVQEALMNILKHAKAKNVSISFAEKDGKLIMVTIEDDGIGIDGPVFLKGHLGMKLMKERVELYNGDLIINKGDNKGTKVCVNIPIDGLQI